MSSKETLLDTLTFRHATKRFDPDKKISDEDFATILEAARLAPSSFGIEPWNIVVLQDRVIRQKLLPFVWGAQGQLPTASHFVLLSAKTARAVQPGSPHFTHLFRDIHHLPPEKIEGRVHRINTFFEEDFKLTKSERAIWDWAGKQAYIALAYMLMAAATLRIDSCPIEGFQAEPVENLLKEEGVIDGADNRLVVMAAFGYRCETPQPKERRPLDEIVKWRRGDR